MYRMATNHESIIAIEFYNKDALTYRKSKIYIQGTGVWIEGHETKKYTYRDGRTNFLYYAKIMVKFKKTSGSPPVSCISWWTMRARMVTLTVILTILPTTCT